MTTALTTDPETGISKAELVQWRSAVANGYPISDETRRQMVRKCERLLRKTKDPRTIVAVAKTLAAMDGINVKREANEIKEREPQGLHLHLHGNDAALQTRAEQYGLTTSRLGSMVARHVSENQPDATPDGGS